MEDEDINWNASTYNENYEFDLWNNLIGNEDGELLHILGLDKPPPEAKTPVSPLPEQSVIPTALSETSLYDYHQLPPYAEHFVEAKHEEEEALEHEQFGASAIELPVTVANFSADKSQLDNTVSINAIVMEPLTHSRISAGKEKGRKRTQSCADDFDDQKLSSMSISDLRQHMSGATREDLNNITKRRRTLKNREYARTSRQKRTRERSESEKSKKTTEEELQCTRIELYNTREELAAVTKDRDEWKAKYGNLLNGFKPIGNEAM